jgi:CheY-like chemotaxis protein
VLAILIVDDDEVIRRGVARLLERAGHSATAIRDAAEAAALAGTFDLGIFDINLGGESGIDLARSLLSAGRVSKVVFFSSESDAAVLAAARALGAVAHNLEALRALLATLA